MSKIIVIGCPGAGKTRFSEKLSVMIGIERYGLDDIYWQEEWRRSSEESFLNKLDCLLNRNQWIIDGNYYSSLERRLDKADLVIYLHYPTILTLYRITKRSIRRRFFSKESLPYNIRTDSNYTPKFNVDLHFTKLVVFFKFKQHKKILHLLNTKSIKCILLKSPKNAQEYLDTISRNVNV